MMDKIHWKKEWRLSPRETKNYYGSVLHKDMVVELIDDREKFTVVLYEEEFNFEANGNFFDFADRSRLISAHVIPNELLEFEVCSYLASENKTKVTIKKISSNEYSVEVYSKEYTGYGLHSPCKDIKEVFNKEELRKKLLNIKDVFEAYPFLVLPLGNCFDEN